MIPVLSLRGAKGPQPPNPTSSAKSIPKPAPKSEIASAVVAPKVIPEIAEKKVEEKKIVLTPTATATSSLAIPNIALRGAKPQQQQQQQQHQQQKSAVISAPPKQIQTESIATIKTVPIVNLSKQKVAVKTATKKRSSPSVVSKLDAQCHALTCLTNLSFRLAVRSQMLRKVHDAQVSMGVVGDVSQIALNALKNMDVISDEQNKESLATRRKDKFLRSRAKQAFAFSHNIGKNIVRTALKRTHRRKIKKSKVASKEGGKIAVIPPADSCQPKSKSQPPQPPIDPKLAKFQEEMRQNKDQMMSISGTRKRERTVKHKKSKRQDGEIDRRALKKLFCLSCGKPKLQGAGFRTMEWRRKRIKTSKVEEAKTKSPEQQMNKISTKAKGKKLLIKCISCSNARNQQQCRMQLKKLLIQNGRKPSSMLRMKTKQRFRKQLNKKISKKMPKNSKFSVRGNKSIPLVSRVQDVNLMKNWACSGKKVMNVSIRRVADRDSKTFAKK